MKKRIKTGNKLIKIERTKKSKPKKTKKVYIENKNKIITAIIILIAIGVGVFFYIRSQKDIQGYWCKYEEASQIQIQLKDGCTEKQKKAIEDKIAKFEDLESVAYFSKEEYANTLGADPKEMDIYDAIIVTLSSIDAIGTYREELKKMSGVYDATQMSAKSNIKLYNIESGRKYTLSDSDEALEEDIITGTYKEKKGVITFKPDNNKYQETMLYYKNGLLCEDSNCTTIFFKSTEDCTPIQAEEK